MTCTLLGCFVLSIPFHAAADEHVELEVPGGILYGTLEAPLVVGSGPVVLIHAGSGPTDRNGNNPISGVNDSLKMLAEALADRGIASLRYDKRGIGQSVGAIAREEDLRFDTYIDDACAWGRWLKSEGRFGRLVVIGHSEGSQIGAVASICIGSDGFVSLAGPGFPAGEGLRIQLKSQLPDALFAASDSVITKLELGELVETPPMSLAALFRPSVQPYLISWFRNDPAEVIGSLEIPVLIVRGTTDRQITPENGQALADANPRARLVTIEGMNHVLKSVSGSLTEQMPSYGDPDLPVVEELIDAITGFIAAIGTEE